MIFGNTTDFKATINGMYLQSIWTLKMMYNGKKFQKHNFVIDVCIIIRRRRRRRRRGILRIIMKIGKMTSAYKEKYT